MQYFYCWQKKHLDKKEEDEIDSFLPVNRTSFLNTTKKNLQNLDDYGVYKRCLQINMVRTMLRQKY